MVQASAYLSIPFSSLQAVSELSVLNVEKLVMDSNRECVHVVSNC